MARIPVAIIGASGYSGEELIRLLLRHEGVALEAVTSRQHAGKLIEEVLPRFTGSGLRFVDSDASCLVGKVEAAFLALPHGLATEFAAPLLAGGVRVVDISADFRLRDPAIYERYYKTAHPAPHLLGEAVYGLPERYREPLRSAALVACAGCYPTSIILPAAPVLAAGLACLDGIVAASLSGVTGAGRKVDLPYIFPECNESLRPYSVTGHRHLPEIEQELSVAAGSGVRMSFIPHLVPVNRGIHSTVILRARDGVTAADVGAVLTSAYADEPFVRILPAGKLADTKHVIYSNVDEIGFTFDSHTGVILLSSAIDNLTKGAAGQAVQCFNLMHGFAETDGLL